MSVVLCLTHKFLRVGRIDGVKHVEEISAIRETSFRKAVWQVSHHLFIVLKLLKQTDNAKLLVFGNFDPLHVCQGEQTLDLGQYLSEEVFVEHGLRRYVKLNYITRCN